MFIDISLVAEKPRDLFGVTVHQLKILLFTKSDDRSQNEFADLIINLVDFFSKFIPAFCFLA